MRHINKGFTLIELMVIVAIMAIIITFAIPHFSDQGDTARRKNATAQLIELVQAMEKDYTLNESYRDVIGLNKFSAQVPRTGDAYYALTVTLPVAGGYLLSATPSGKQLGDKCGALTVSDTGVKTPADCW